MIFEIISIIEFVILAIICLRRFTSKEKFGGKLIVDEARDQWTIAITEDPEEVNKSKSIRLKIEKQL